MAWLLTTVWIGGAPSVARPTSGALRRSFEAGKVSVVEVESPRGKGLGVLVGSGGEVLTSVRFVELESARVRRGDDVHLAHVRFARAELGVALLDIDAPGPFPAAAVRGSSPPAGGWVVGIEGSGNAKKGLTPRLGRVRRTRGKTEPAFFETSLALAPGSPVLDIDGKLLGVVVTRTEGGSRALAVAALRAMLAPAPPEESAPAQEKAP